MNRPQEQQLHALALACVGAAQLHCRALQELLACLIERRQTADAYRLRCSLDQYEAALAELRSRAEAFRT